MKAYQRSAGAIMVINFQLMGVVGYGLMAWFCWPASPEWWSRGESNP